MLDSRPRGRGFEPHLRHCVVSLSKNINPSLVLVQPRKTRPFITENLLMGRKESNQTNKQHPHTCVQNWYQIIADVKNCYLIVTDVSDKTMKNWIQMRNAADFLVGGGGVFGGCNVKICMFVCLILYVQSTIFQLCRDGPSCVEPLQR